MYGPSLCRPTLLWAEFAMGQVCYWPRCPVTKKNQGFKNLMLDSGIKHAFNMRKDNIN